MNELIRVGRLAAVFGTRGWLRVVSHTRPPENLMDYRPWHLSRGDSWVPYTIEQVRRHHGGLIVKLAGIDDPDAATALRGHDIAVERGQLGDAAPGEYFWSDLIGLQVCNTADEVLGVVAGLVETPAHDVLCVSGERDRLIPFVSGVYVLDVDLTVGAIRVDWHRDD